MVAMSFEHRISQNRLRAIGQTGAAAICMATLAILLSGTACSSTHGNESADADEVVKDAAQLSAALDRGRARWQQSSAANANYFYWRVRPAGMQPITTITGVQVKNGRVHARYVTRSQRNSSGNFEIVETRRETSPTALRQRPGFPARTLPQLVAACSELLGVSGSRPRVSADSDHFGLSFDGRGVMQTCYRVPRGCMDDCGTSFGVSGLVFRVLGPAEIDSFLKTGTLAPDSK